MSKTPHLKSLAYVVILFLSLPLVVNAQVVVKTQEKSVKKKIRTNGKSVELNAFPVKIDLDECPDMAYRTIDGTCNNRTNDMTVDWGAAGSPLDRIVDPQYGLPDALNDMGGQSRPSARHVSNTVSSQTVAGTSAENLSAFVFTWGQFLDHDITLTPEDHIEYEPVVLPDNEMLFENDIPFLRSAIHEGTGVTDTRQQTNAITSWVDASNVYGSDMERANWLRTFSDGKLKTSAGDLLPYNTVDGELGSLIDVNAPSMAGDNDFTTTVFVAGDVRANEQSGLTILHTIFVREHNRICNQLLDQGMTNDEEIYQRARQGVGALIQNITFQEFLPALGIDLPPYNGYNPQMKPDISNLFATAAYRLGHTMVTSEIMMLDEDCNAVGEGTLSLIDAFFNLSPLQENGLEPFIYGFARQEQMEVDAQIVDELRNFLFQIQGGGSFGLDLASLNIQRGRDHGLPDYATVREHYLGQDLNGWYQITSSPTLQTALSASFNDNWNDIDLWVGLLAEDHLPGASVGPTLEAILMSQFIQLRDGDFYYFENDPMLNNNFVQNIMNTSLSEVIERNTEIDQLQNNIFVAQSCQQMADNNNGQGGNNNNGPGGNNNNGPGGNNNNGPGGNNNNGPGGNNNNGPGGNNNNGPGQFAGGGPGGPRPGGRPGGGQGGNNGPGKTNLEENAAPIVFDVYPNPATESINIAHSVTERGALQIKITDLSGRSVLEETYNVEIGMFNQKIGVNNLVNGVYIVHLLTGSVDQQIKLIVSN